MPRTTEAEPSDLIDQRLVKALGHPLRMRLLTLLAERVASPVEMARELGEPLGNVSYHTRILHELECIELVKTTPRRGAVEHHYRAIVRPFFSDADWSALPRPARASITDAVLNDIWGDVQAARGAGAMETRTDLHLSRTPLTLDEEGWSRVSAILEQVLADVMDEAAASANRVSKAGDRATTITSRLAILHFPMPEQARAVRTRSRRTR